MKNQNDSIFNVQSLGDLGTSYTPIGVDDVGYMIQMSHLEQGTVEHPCIFCGRESKYKVVRKILGAPVGEKSYACETCLQVGKLDKKLYGIRERK